jgi:hypothetical protein
LFAQNALPFVSEAWQNCVLHESRIPGSNSIETEDQVQDPFISKFVRSFACKLERSHLQEIPMRALFRPVATALTIVCFAASFAALSTHSALAQAKPQAAPPAQAGQAPPQLKQIALTDKQIDGVLAAQKEMNPITDKLPDNAPPDAKIMTQLEAIAKKNGFASFDDYNNVVDNISLVMGGIDPATKKYVGSEAVIKSQIAMVEADKKMSANDKKQTLADLNTALKAPEPQVENKGNVDLVVKNYDKLNEALGADQ